MRGKLRPPPLRPLPRRHLDGRAREKKTVLSVEALELADEAAVAVLDALALVHDEVLPLEVFEVAAVDDADLV